jgi:hypothetical protein
MSNEWLPRQKLFSALGSRHCYFPERGKGSIARQVADGLSISQRAYSIANRHLLEETTALF